jgi:hypothetical protein
MPSPGKRDITPNGLVMPNGRGDEQDDISNWPVMDQMLSGTHPTVRLPRLNAHNQIVDAAGNRVGRSADFDVRPGVVVLPGGQVAAPGGWNVSGSSATLTVSPETYDGRPVTRIDFPAGDQYLTLRAKLRVDLNGAYGKIELPVFLPHGFGSSAEVRVRVSSDSPAADPPTVDPTNEQSFIFSNPAHNRGGWNIFSIDPAASGATIPANVTVSAAAGTGGGTAWKQVRLYIYMPASATERYMLISDLMVGSYAKPWLMLSFDGAGSDAAHVTLLEPVLRKYGLKAIFAPQGQIIASYATTLQRLKNAGHEIANEGLNHLNYQSNPATLYTDYDTTQATLAQYGLASSSSPFMAPQLSLSTTDRIGLLNRGTPYIRAGGRETIPVSALGDVQLIAGGFQIDQKSGAQMIEFLDRMQLHGESALMYGHGPVSGTAGSLQFNMTEFETFAAEAAKRIAEGRLLQGTPSQFAAAYRNR